MRLDSTQTKVVPDISRAKKFRHYFGALDEPESGRYFSDSRAFMAVPVSYQRAQRALQQHGHATHSWDCLMMRLKSFRPEVDKSWRVIYYKSQSRQMVVLSIFSEYFFYVNNKKNFIFCDIQLSLKYIHTGQTEMMCPHLGNAYSMLNINSTCAVIRINYRMHGNANVIFPGGRGK